MYTIFDREPCGKLTIVMVTSDLNIARAYMRDSAYTVIAGLGDGK